MIIVKGGKYVQPPKMPGACDLTEDMYVFYWVVVVRTRGTRKEYDVSHCSAMAPRKPFMYNQ